MIAYGMLYAGVVGLSLVVSAELLAAALRWRQRAERWVWVAALGLAPALPLVGLASTRAEAPAAPTPVADAGWNTPPEVVSLPAVPAVTVPVTRSALDLDETLIALWAVASLIMVIRWILATTRLAALTRACPSTTLDGFRVVLTPDLGPAVAGVVDPCILVPAWLKAMPAAQRSWVLLHEEEHVRARDPVLIVLSRLTRILLPWNPAVWMLSSRLFRAIEVDCDRRVLRRRPDVEAYGTTLLNISSRDPGGLVGAAAFAEPDTPLRKRILAMTTRPGTVSVVSVVTALVLGVLLLAAALEIPVPSIPVPLAVEEDAGEEGADATLRGVITVTVRDDVRDAPIEYAQVFVRETGLGGLTDDGGKLLLRVPPGEHQVIAHRIGYGDVTLTLRVGDEETAAADFRLSPTAIGLDPVVLRTSREDGGAGLEAGRPAADPAAPSNYARPGPLTRLTSRRQLVFTPYSVAPRLENPAGVQRATAAALPSELRAEAAGAVRVYFFIDEAGRVLDTRIDRSSGRPALDDAALAAARAYRFSPALNRDQPVPVWVAFAIRFAGAG